MQDCYYINQVIDTKPHKTHTEASVFMLVDASGIENKIERRKMKKKNSDSINNKLKTELQSTCFLFLICILYIVIGVCCRC